MSSVRCAVDDFACRDIDGTGAGGDKFVGRRAAQVHGGAGGRQDAAVIRRILEHLGLWAPRVSERSPPLSPEAWPVHARLPLTYHPAPDIV